MAVAPSEALEVSAVGAAAPWSCSVNKNHPEAGAPCSHAGAVPVLHPKAPAGHSPVGSWAAEWPWAQGVEPWVRGTSGWQWIRQEAERCQQCEGSCDGLRITLINGGRGYLSPSLQTPFLCAAR